MRTIAETDLNESEIDLNECEHFLEAKLAWSEIDQSWMNLVSMAILRDHRILKTEHESTRSQGDALFTQSSHKTSTKTTTFIIRNTLYLLHMLECKYI